MTSPALSVLMPVYNGERYLQSALDSILAQTFSDFEIVAVDDGSTDASIEILELAARNDDRIRVLSRPNTGIVGALNDGLSLCRADLVARMDCDDIAAPDRFQQQVDYLRAHPECVAVGTCVSLIDYDGDPIGPWACPLDHDSIDGAHLRGEGGAITHPSVIMRRAALEEVGAYRKDFEPAEDLDLFLRLAERGRLVNLPSVLLSWRMHFTSTGSTQRERQRDAAFRAVADACARRGLEPPTLDSLPSLGEPRCPLRAKWTWWALAAGNVRTARKHAWASFVSEPLKRENWRLMACAVRGH